MVPLLVIAALMLLASGLLKLRAAARVEMGLPVLALVEVLAGGGLLGAALLADLTGAQGMAVLVGSVVLIVASSVQVGLAVRRRQRVRGASEGARLANYVRYLSGPGAPGEVGPGGGRGTDRTER